MSETEAGVRWLRGADAKLVIAVWVTRTLPAQFHSGLYHRDYGAAKVLHFAWDRDLREDVPEELFVGSGHGLVALSLDDDDAQALCALCRHVAQKHARDLHYRITEWRPRFHVTTGELIPPPPDERYGFTCATFVLAMLRSAVVEELLALEEWPIPTADDQDDRWQRRITRLLCKHESSSEQVAKIVAGIGARRVLPTDVAGGAMQLKERWPVRFVDARQDGEQIAASLP